MDSFMGIGGGSVWLCDLNYVGSRPMSDREEPLKPRQANRWERTVRDLHNRQSDFLQGRNLGGRQASQRRPKVLERVKAVAA